MKRPRRNHSAAFKATVALAAIRGDNTLAELAANFQAHPNQITLWKGRFLDRVATVYGESAPAPETASTIKALHAKFRQPAMENDLLEGALNKAGL